MRLTDDDGVDGPFEKAMDQAMADDKRKAELREKALREGERMAAKVFEKRRKNKPLDHEQVEVHLDRKHLTAYLALAFELGYEAGTKKGAK